jgi:hypothetical protein
LGMREDRVAQLPERLGELSAARVEVLQVGQGPLGFGLLVRRGYRG